MVKESATSTASESDKKLATAKKPTMGVEFAEENPTSIKASSVKQSTSTEASEINEEPALIEGSTINKAFNSDKSLSTDKESIAVASESEEELQTAKENIADEAS